MSDLKNFPIVLSGRFRPFSAWMDEKQAGMGRPRYFFFICAMLLPILMCGCGHLNEGFKAKSTFEEANDLSSQGHYLASLDKYEQIIKKYPTTGDRVLFEMGIVYAHPKNEHKDYQKSLECFQQLVKDYPESGYRHDSEMMIFNINNVIMKDKMIAAQQTEIERRQAQIEMQQTQIGTLRQEVESRENEISTLQNRIKALEQKIFVSRKRSVDKILVEKKERRLMLISKGEVLKSYRIALGENPNGPKERLGDNKTPEGSYFIDARNTDSRYHLSLHISYPNERDKKRARALGVSPGGDIMIHGIKNGYSWVGDAQSEVDWTKGCIAVTDEEIEEIAKLSPNGTAVEIRP